MATSIPTVSERFEELDPHYLAYAITEVYRQLDEEKEQPGSDYKWIINPHYSRKLYELLEAKWRELSDNASDEFQFPYSMAYVQYKWIQFRKSKDELKSAWTQQGKLHVS